MRRLVRPLLWTPLLVSSLDAADLLAVSATPEAAAARHAALFGWKPVHPGPGGWAWTERRIESSAYGTAARGKTPEYRPGTVDFGLFAGVERLSVNMQLEAGGLRAVTRWR
jgi:hypothetical protein